MKSATQEQIRYIIETPDQDQGKKSSGGKSTKSKTTYNLRSTKSSRTIKIKIKKPLNSDEQERRSQTARVHRIDESEAAAGIYRPRSRHGERLRSTGNGR